MCGRAQPHGFHHEVLSVAIFRTAKPRILEASGVVYVPMCQLGTVYSLNYPEEFAHDPTILPYGNHKPRENSRIILFSSCQTTAAWFAIRPRVILDGMHASSTYLGLTQPYPY